MGNFEDHEPLSKARYNEMQGKLDTYVTEGNEGGMRLLAARLDAQLKLEDFLIRFREAEHAWVKVWATIFISAAVSLTVSVLAALVTRK